MIPKFNYTTDDLRQGITLHGVTLRVIDTAGATGKFNVLINESTLKELSLNQIIWLYRFTPARVAINLLTK